MLIDSHIHLLPKKVRLNRESFCKTDPAFGLLYSSEKAKIATEEEIIDYLDEFSIDKAFIFGFPWEDHDVISRNNEEIWNFHQRYPQRIIPFAALSPKGGEAAGLEAESTLKAGFVGLGELAVYKKGWGQRDFDALGPAFQAAKTFGAIVVIHVNEPVGHDYPGKIKVDFNALVRLIGVYPEIDFVLAHFGGGIFVYNLMPEITTIFTKTYLDTAASPFLYQPQVYEVATRIMGENKIIFGSDFPLLSVSKYLTQLEECDLTQEVRRAILGENALNLIKKR